MRSLSTILVTGGAGFIGSNFIHWLFAQPEFTGRVINLDALTYAGNLENLADIEARYGKGAEASGAVPRYVFVQGDICDRPLVERLFAEYGVDTVVHFAAESHVDRSILGPEAFVRTNVLGTYTLLDVARQAWRAPSGGMREDVLFHHVSTDEVFGSLGEEGYFTESTPYDPRSPYSASKAASDHLAKAYHHTYGLPLTLSNCSNNYGPYQFPEKLIPLMILNMLEGKPLPVYGDGRNIRDWLYVEDHNEAVWTIMRNGQSGRTYNIGGENEWENIRLLERLIELVAEEAHLDIARLRGLITYVKDRPGHDRRYAIDCTRLKTELGWRQRISFDEGLRKTIRWYLDHREWVEHVRSGAYRAWIEQNYARRV
ncbi:dTDP-glucose 4,6-dehydratase [Rectinema subterraneum]|jgi:dTDP-glucose 4,6-dehydratase|uniref:dTDP-glucose 4,6-dehydratase n=1 Tax=Rectinema subterraneum TaxID=2653714 RepID=UPI00131BEB38|nr:dTDP-glucose 4,6-dehydratase [Rectinema subterraneum]